MFTRFANVFFAPDDDLGGGGGAPAPGTDESPEAIAAARAAFLNDPPDMPEIPAEEVGDEIDPDAGLLDDLTTPPAGVVADAPATGGTPEDPYAEFGGRERVEAALRTDAALRTESGLRLVIAQGLQALNYTPAQIRAALEGGPALPLPAEPEAAPANPWDSIEDDDFVDGATFKQMIAAATQQAAEQAAAAVAGQVAPVADAFQAQQERVAAEAADTTYLEILGAFPDATEPDKQQEWVDARARLQQVGGQFIDADDWSPSSVRMALLRAAEAVKAQDEENLRRYVAKKRADRDANPTNVGGGQPPGGEVEKEPQNLAEARERFFKQEGIPSN